MNMLVWCNVGAPPLCRPAALAVAVYCVLSSFCSEAVAHGYTCVEVSGAEVELLPDPSCPTTIRVSIIACRVVHFEPLQEIGARARFVACDGRTLETLEFHPISQEWTGDHNCHAISPNPVEHSIDSLDYPAKVVLERKGACTDGDWQTDPDFPEIPVPPPVLSCPLYVDQVCYLCEGPPGDLHWEMLQFYKSAHFLYTLRTDDKTGASWGEAVNGQFIAPTAGILVVNVAGSSEAVNLWGSPSPNAPGWMVYDETGGKPKRRGTLITSYKCLEIDSGQRFFFNIRTGKRDAKSTFKATFDWVWWNDVSCCFEHDRKVLNLKVEPVPEPRVPMDPVVPQRRDWSYSDGTDQYTDVELQIPLCSSGQKGGKGIAGLSAPFIAWPSAGSGDVIPDGHAMGWKIVGNSLFAPGLEVIEYQFVP